MSTCVTVLDLILKITQVVGIPVAIILFWMKRREEQLAREYGTYDALDQRYIDYVKLCLTQPDLDVADLPKPNAGEATPAERHREQMMFSILISVMERAYLMYSDKSTTIRRQQWAGWDAYIRDWCSRANFVRTLRVVEEEFDEKFIAYISGLLRERDPET